MGDILADINQKKAGLDLGGVCAHRLLPMLLHLFLTRPGAVADHLKAVRKGGGSELKLNEFIKTFTILDMQIKNLHHRQEVKVLSYGELDGDNDDKLKVHIAPEPPPSLAVCAVVWKACRLASMMSISTHRTLHTLLASQ